MAVIILNSNVSSRTWASSTFQLRENTTSQPLRIWGPSCPTSTRLHTENRNDSAAQNLRDLPRFLLAAAAGGPEELLIYSVNPHPQCQPASLPQLIGPQPTMLCGLSPPARRTTGRQSRKPFAAKTRQDKGPNSLILDAVAWSGCAGCIN